MLTIRMFLPQRLLARFIFFGLTIFVLPCSSFASFLLESRACQALLLPSNVYQRTLAYDYFKLRYTPIIDADEQKFSIQKVYFSDTAKKNVYGEYFDNSLRIIVQGVEIAALTFRYRPSNEKEFDIESIHVDPPFRGQKLFRLLAASILLLRPQTELIRGTFDITNYADFKRGIEQGLSKEDAIRQTHSYRTFTPYGFENFAITNYSGLGHPEVERYRTY